MPVVDNRNVSFLPSQDKIKPPTECPNDPEEGRESYLWYITEDECLRLNKLLSSRDFQETDMGGTRAVGLPSACKGCGRYTEFIDWVCTALRRGVHTGEFEYGLYRKIEKQCTKRGGPGCAA